MSDAQTNEQVIDIKAAVAAIIESIDQEREREIITRRFGLYERKETLEQIGAWHYPRACTPARKGDSYPY